MSCAADCSVGMFGLQGTPTVPMAYDSDDEDTWPRYSSEENESRGTVAIQDEEPLRCTW
jgi:hypothetical protein